MVEDRAGSIEETQYGRVPAVSWRASLTKVADNPDFIQLNAAAILKELEGDNPDTDYLRQKVRNISQWINEIDKFHYQRKVKEVV
jgi:hypothetical protein